MTSSLYIHIPFCESKCSYCSFNSYAGLDDLQTRYVEALCADMAKTADSVHVEPLRTVFLGGGTPSILPSNLLRKIIETSSTLFPFADDSEISIEINPGTMEMAKLESLQESGVNRISFGVQSFNDLELKQIGRIHTADEAVAAINMADEAGFTNISLDLMYGLPGQTPLSWQQSLETAIALGVKHLSLYQLTVEEQTPMEKMVDEGKICLPDEDALSAMDETTSQLTKESGLDQYEISNYAQSGYQCRHNIVYWQNKDYLGFGAGAVSCVQGSRRRTVAAPVQYCERVETEKSVIVEEETLKKDASFRETVIMGLRMNQGVSKSLLSSRYRANPTDFYGEKLSKLITEGLIQQSEEYLFLTERGREIANLVMSELV